MALSTTRPAAPPASAGSARRTLRARFSETSAATASPARLVTMLYDRLVRDLHEARAALEAGDGHRAHTALVHGQDVVAALRDALDPAAWPPARELGRVYGWVHDTLVTANLRKDPTGVVDALAVVEPLRDAWHEAFRSVGAT